LFDTIAHDANNTGSLTQYFIQSVKAAGGSLAYTDNEGLFESTLNYEVQFSVQEDAWASLA
jgi:hypothetical protein